MERGPRPHSRAYFRSARRCRKSNHGWQSGATLLTVIVSLDPIHFIFDGSESDLLHYLRLAASGGRRSSRDVQNPVAVRLADETDFKHTGRMDSSITPLTRRQVRFAVVPSSITRMDF